MFFSHSAIQLDVVDDGGALRPIGAADPATRHLLLLLITISPDLVAVSGVTAAAALRAGHPW